ncbi:glutamine--fructose-6-phosphate transaminase (isomerizing) [Candidatus Wolfebacteria bacterium]|nr:glutamine--fructose-6-phosphate transaminase (isomerizing) [Candidatus Wolfebacteria bacterium]
MCGIVSYVGNKKAAPLLLEGLRRLEYRGYDSSGISVSNDKNKITTVKAVGKVNNLISMVEEKTLEGNWGIAHTRWATHGPPTKNNAHPHFDCAKNIFLAHNGIIENYQELKEKLSKEGHIFISETDTEILAHLIEKFFENNLEKAVIKALKLVKGTYGLAVISASDPKKIVIARNSSPILIGVGNGEFVAASDASAILAHTNKVIYLNDGEIAVITPRGMEFTNLSREKLSKKTEVLEWDIEEIKKGGHPHFMHKEIFEQPESIKSSIAGRLIEKEGMAKLGGLENFEEKLRGVERIIITGCGTAYLAGLVGEYMIEEYAGIPVEVEYASEFRYRKPVIDKKTALLCVSQSGETADTLAALQEAKRKGILTLGIVNVVGSTIARETDAGIYNHIGPEIAVASTKAFTSQLAVFSLLTLFLGRQRQMSLTMGRRISEEIKQLPNLISEILKQEKEIKRLAKKYHKSSGFLYLGRKYNYPIASEGALKLKEVSYTHAEGYSAGEMKHGVIALIDKNFPTMGIAPYDSVYEKMISNLEEIKARKGPIVAVATKGKDKDIKRITEDIIYIPKTLEMLTPILAVIPLQLFAYYCSVFKGIDPDKPRNLAKSVTVE